MPTTPENHAEPYTEYLDTATESPDMTNGVTRRFTEREFPWLPPRPAWIDPVAGVDYDESWFSELEPETFSIRFLAQSLAVYKQIQRLQKMLATRLRGHDKMHGRNTKCNICGCKIRLGI
jgi:hypothetical protein